MAQSQSRKIKYAFIVHSRDRSDLPRRFPFLRHVPKIFFDLISFHLRPFIVSKITGLIDDVGSPISGYVIGIPMTARQLLENRQKALDRIMQATHLAKKMGAKYVGLGAMTASLSRGGRDVIERVNDVYVTTGRTYTAKNITDTIAYCCNIFNLKNDTVKIAIVGAAGGIGSGVATALARVGYRKFTLIDQERKLVKLAEGISNIEKNVSGLNIKISHKISEVELCDIIVAATSSPEAVIESKDVSPGTIIVNDAQPSDISPEIIKNRTDVLVIEGGVLHTDNIDCHLDFGLAHKEDIFSCLAETQILARVDPTSHYSIEDFNPELYSHLESQATELGFRICLQNDMGIISENDVSKFATMIAKRHAV